jgi:hypothetical protein
VDLTRFDCRQGAVDLDALVAVEAGDLPDAAVADHLLALHRAKTLIEGRLSAATGVFDRRMLHTADAARTPAGWLAARVDQTPAQCRADSRLARELRGLPAVAAAFHAGRLGRAKVELLAAIRTPELAEVMAEHEADLVEKVEPLRVADAAGFLRCWQEAARRSVAWRDPDGPVDTTAPPVAVDLSPTFEGRYVLGGEMDGEHGSIMRGAIDAEIDEMFRLGVYTADDGLGPAERRGRALVQIIARRAHAGTKQGRPRPSVEVICDERTLVGLPIEDDEDLQRRVCELVDGTPLAPASLHRLLCGADIHRLVVSAAGEVLDAGKDIRLANRAQRRALRFRHGRHCAFPGCEAPIDWCEAHHVEEFDPDPTNDRGRTDMVNLVPLCRSHHHRVHEGGFTLALEPDGTVVAHRPPDRGGGRCPVTPARRWRTPVEPHRDAVLARQRFSALVAAAR